MKKLDIRFSFCENFFTTTLLLFAALEIVRFYAYSQISVNIVFFWELAYFMKIINNIYYYLLSIVIIVYSISF